MLTACDALGVLTLSVDEPIILLQWVVYSTTHCSYPLS